MHPFFRRLVTHALYGFPRPLLPGRTDLERLRAHSLGERLRHKPAPERLALMLVALAGYPVMAVVESWRSVAFIRRRNPRLPLVEGLRIASFALLRNIPPTEYAVYEFDRPEVRAEAAEYLYWIDLPALLWMNRQRGADNRDVQDKARFADLCGEHGLAHVTTLAEFRGGEQVAGSPAGEIAETQLWVKPVDLNAGRGAMGWTREGDVYRSDDGLVLTREQWLAYLRAAAHIVQRRLRNHPDLEPITNGALAGMRLNIVADRAGNAELIGAAIGLPYGVGAATTTGGVGGAIDPASGTIIRTFHHSIDLSNGHPDTGVAIVGRRVPFFDKAVALALRAHSTAFPKFASLGWDVVITPDGPFLLEANSGWGAMGQQIFFGPLGKTAMSHVVREELERVR